MNWSRTSSSALMAQGGMGGPFPIRKICHAIRFKEVDFAKGPGPCAFWSMASRHWTCIDCRESTPSYTFIAHRAGDQGFRQKRPDAMHSDDESLGPDCGTAMTSRADGFAFGQPAFRWVGARTALRSCDRAQREAAGKRQCSRTFSRALRDAWRFAQALRSCTRARARCR